ARSHGFDLVEVSASANPPVCRIVDFGKFKYEHAKRERDSRKHQHANIVKEVQLTPRIDPHDLGIKQEHAVAFLCEDMKVKVSLRFRGREMAHTEIGMGVVQKFLKDLSPWGHPDFTPKLVGRSINVMVSPLPRAKRARNPKEEAPEREAAPAPGGKAPETSATDRARPSAPPPPPDVDPAAPEPEA
ncbi:MAG: translation initiation factor IF-3, partial [Verrucomicrobia bacterium]|nr:translation initiation factor IF-3 [Verrucomicrobiota bacterium]